LTPSIAHTYDRQTVIYIYIYIHIFTAGLRSSLPTLVDFAEDYNTRELCLGVVGNLWVESEDAHAAAILSCDILVRFLDQHFGSVGVVV